MTATSEGKIDWTNRTAPGITDAARDHGYGGPTNMAFFRLARVRVTDSHRSMPELGAIPIGLTEASLTQVALLNAVLPIE